MSIRIRFFFAFSILVALACALALCGMRGIVSSGDIVLRLYDGPLTGINHARSAQAELNEARLLIATDADSGSRAETEIKFGALVTAIADDLSIVRDRIQDPDVIRALAAAEGRIRDWSSAGFEFLSGHADGLATAPSGSDIAQMSNEASAALDNLSEKVAIYGFGYRMEAQAKVADTRAALLMLAVGAILIGLILAIGCSHSMSKPIREAMQIAERVAAGNLGDQIVNTRNDEFGHLLTSLAAMQSHLKTRADEDYAMMEKLDVALNSMSQGLCMFGPDQRLMLWNERYARMYRIPPERLFVGCTVEDLLEARRIAGTTNRNAAQYDAKMKAAIQTGSRDNMIAELIDGRIVKIECQPTPKGSYIVIHEDITESTENEARIAHLAFHDPLTDLPNRAAFSDQIAKTLRSAAASQDTFAVLCIDLDRFKEINDVYGHAAGDQFLIEVGFRLEMACNGAFLARQGGDEFTIISSGGPQPDTAEQLCKRLSSVFDTPVRVEDMDIGGNFTVGVSIYPQDGADVNTLVANAEAALYRAKVQERGTIRFFEPAMDQQIREKRSLHLDVALALEKNELELYYQPQAMIGGDIFGFEVLLRWRHPVRGAVPPGLFIPLAEEIGAIGPIDEWVLREACREAASWPNPLSIAVNLSPVDFRQGNVPDMILSALLDTGLNPQRLEIEITEGVLIEDFDRAIETLRKIKNLGVRVAMDDFGSGYSSLSYLQSFPFDKIKIDQSFIAKIGKSYPAAAIIHAIVGLGRSLTLPIIAEGVETAEQLAFLAKEGCDEAQGYLIGRPEPIVRYQHVIGKLIDAPEAAAIAS